MCPTKVFFKPKPSFALLERIGEAIALAKRSFSVGLSISFSSSTIAISALLRDGVSLKWLYKIS